MDKVSDSKFCIVTTTEQIYWLSSIEVWVRNAAAFSKTYVI